jgi:L-amino acid N-acyltransferase YncA
VTELRPAEPTDLPAVAGIFGHYVETSGATFELITPEISVWEGKLAEARRRGWPFLVAVDDERLLGFAYTGPWRSPGAYLHTAEESIYLSPDSVGQGLGRRLLSRLIDDASAAGVRQLLAVIADTGNPASPALHRGLGFHEVGRLAQVGLKHGRWLDTCLFQRELVALI